MFPFPAGVYVIVLGAMLVFGGVNWFLSWEDEQVLLYNRTGGYVFSLFSRKLLGNDKLLTS